MNCESCQSQLIDFEHGELDPQARAGVARHLATCPDCALESCRLRADLEGIVDAWSESPAASVRERLRARVEHAVRPRWRHRVASTLRQPIPVYAAALAAVAPFAVWGAVSLSGADGQSPSSPQHPPTIEDYDGIATRVNAPGVL